MRALRGRPRVSCGGLAPPTPPSRTSVRCAPLWPTHPPSDFSFMWGLRPHAPAGSAAPPRLRGLLPPRPEGEGGEGRGAPGPAIEGSPVPSPLDARRSRTALGAVFRLPIRWGWGGRSPRRKKNEGRVGGPSRAQRARPGWGCGGPARYPRVPIEAAPRTRRSGCRGAKTRRRSDRGVRLHPAALAPGGPLTSRPLPQGDESAGPPSKREFRQGLPRSRLSSGSPCPGRRPSRSRPR